MYYPQDFILVPASHPYPKDTFYKVSLGQQKIDAYFHEVVKIEMVFNGAVGRGGKVNAAFPCHGNDLKKVLEAINDLHKFKLEH
uniref:hypothetical protein n=1 Tax=Bacillaceae bacterium JMAK1 TaxID=1028381 RepID=UPI00155DCE5E|nr:hypothetical protein [Bacillaceae bacterium JMAK1]